MAGEEPCQLKDLCTISGSGITVHWATSGIWPWATWSNFENGADSEQAIWTRWLQGLFQPKLLYCLFFPVFEIWDQPVWGQFVLLCAHNLDTS